MSRPCVATALALHSEILDRIEDMDFAVFARRARVSQARGRLHAVVGGGGIAGLAAATGLAAMFHIYFLGSSDDLAYAERRYQLRSM